MRCARRAIELGDVVAVIGLGLWGSWVAQLVRLQGGVVVGVDLERPAGTGPRAGRRPRHRGRIGAGSGARAPPTDRGVDCAIVAAASKSAAPAHSFEACARPRAHLHRGRVGMEFPWNDITSRKSQLYMSRAYGPGSYDAASEKQGRDYPLPYVRWEENRQYGGSPAPDRGRAPSTCAR